MAINMRDPQVLKQIRKVFKKYEGDKEKMQQLQLYIIMAAKHKDSIEEVLELAEEALVQNAK